MHVWFSGLDYFDMDKLVITIINAWCHTCDHCLFVVLFSSYDTYLNNRCHVTRLWAKSKRDSMVFLIFVIDPAWAASFIRATPSSAYSKPRKMKKDGEVPEWCVTLFPQITSTIIPPPLPVVLLIKAIRWMNRTTGERKGGTAPLRTEPVVWQHSLSFKLFDDLDLWPGNPKI